MKSEYWRMVGEKFKSLGKTAVDIAVPLVVDYAVVKAVEKACSVVEAKLKETYRTAEINSALAFVINFEAVLILVLKPFGKTGSRCVAFAFFLASFVFWLVRVVRFVKKYGRTASEVSKEVLKEKSVYTGIEKYVLANFPFISFAYAGISLAAGYVPALRKIPRISEFVACLVKIFWKRIASFAGIMAAYTVLVFWVVKPILVRRFF